MTAPCFLCGNDATNTELVCTKCVKHRTEGGGVSFTSAPTSDDVCKRKRLEARNQEASDTVNHPAHYTSHPSGVECIAVTEHMNFCIGNAIKYLWRADDKGDPIENLQKAHWYIEREIERRS